MLPLDSVSSSKTKGRRTREQVAEEMQTLMRHRTVERRGWATLFALGEGEGWVEEKGRRVWCAVIILVNVEERWNKLRAGSDFLVRVGGGAGCSGRT
jgi:hypothetical protein